MPNYTETYLVDRIRDAVIGAYRSLHGAPPQADVQVRATDRPDFGDYATNVALLEAKAVGVAPRQLAEGLTRALREKLSPEDVPRIDVAGPGFINVFTSSHLIQDVLAQILADGDAYGRWSIGGASKTQLEFVSSNPTGPLTVGHGRQAVLGDVLATLFEWIGHNVHREYYFNDEGRQIELLTDSTAERILEIAFDTEPRIPEDGYAGEYLKETARAILEESSEVAHAVKALQDVASPPITRVALYEQLDPAVLRHEATERIIHSIKDDLAQLGVRFDTWFSEATLHRSGEVDATLEALRERKAVEDRDGAQWLRAEEHGGAKDSVLIRSDGRPTYLMVDVAYHLNKHERSFDRVINVQGADHHAEQTCMLAAMRILGLPEGWLSYAVHQFVSLKEGGETLKMSTRAGRFVTLGQLIDELGKDIVRWFMISRKPEAHLDFDLDLARAESQDNPATYVQYAHTRIASIFRKTDESDRAWAEVDLSPLVEPEELELIKALDRFPDIIRTSAEGFAPHLLAEYALGLSRSFHAYYDKHRVLTDDEPLTLARLALLHALQTVLRNTLEILGMETPEEM
jgi:arginyl-tRNA synthetase